jgi:hypothetical protein
MKYRIPLAILLLAVLFSLQTVEVCAQAFVRPENSVWAFGKRAGMDFSGGTPVPIRTAMNTNEASAAVSDAEGRLLFYTDGSFVWDRNGSPMPNGIMLTGLGASGTSIESVTSSSSHGTVIVPVPGNPHQYFIFSVTQMELSYADPKLYGRLYYSIVDMRLNNGNGDVLVDRKGILLDSNYQEKIAAVTGDGCYYWLVGHHRDSALFKSWKITADGIISQPVKSYVGPTPAASIATNYYGILLFSPDRRKLVITNNGSGFRPTQLYDFDPATGVISGPLLEASSINAAFSPGSNLLYLDDLQYNISGVPMAMYQTGISTDMKLGRDGKIYFFSSSGYGVIHAPDVVGPNCQVQVAPPAVVPLNNTSGKQFSNEVPWLGYDTVYTQKEFCFRDSVLLVAEDTMGSHYTWQDGTEGFSRMVDTGGIFVLTHFSPSACLWHMDTFLVKRTEQVSLGPDTVLCSMDLFVLRANVAGAAYRWQDGSTADTFIVQQSGIYRVEADLDGCRSADTVVVRMLDLAQDLGPDILLCDDVPILVNLTANVPEDAQVRWHDGMEASERQVTDTGLYWVFVSFEQCSGSDTMRLSTEPCDCSIFIPSAFTPDGNGE